MNLAYLYRFLREQCGYSRVEESHGFLPQGSKGARRPLGHSVPANYSSTFYKPGPSTHSLALFIDFFRRSVAGASGQNNLVSDLPYS